ncbi:MAG: transketolase family protein [Coriobacteriales bacterium]|nr:transketolase family protein [Coriobacteriales bacterium]
MTQKSEAPKKATRSAYGETLVELVALGHDIVAIDADLTGSTTTAVLGKKYPDRLINVGIAEQNMIGVASGMSLAGKTAFTGSFAVFGTGRVYDQIRNTVCYSKLNVKIVPTHAGISVGPDGGSHQMLEDIALMRVLPNMRVLVPADYTSAKAAIRLAAGTPGPVYVRLGRASVPILYGEQFALSSYESHHDLCHESLAESHGNLQDDSSGNAHKLTEDASQMSGGFAFGKANVLRTGTDISLIACGIEVAYALEAATILEQHGVSAEVIDVFSIKPLDETTILGSIKKTGAVVSCEEHMLTGGLASAIAELLANNPGVCKRPLGRIGVDDRFGTSAEIDELFAEYRLNAKSISNMALSVL